MGLHDTGMTFRRGFVIGQSTFFSPDVKDAVGQPSALAGVEPPGFIDEGSLVEVDDAYQGNRAWESSLVRTAVPEHEGHYFVAELRTDELTDARAEFATARIDAIEKQQRIDMVADSAKGWVERGVVLWWTKSPPDGVEVRAEAAVVAASADSITFRLGSGVEVDVPFAKFEPEDVLFKRTNEEIGEREQKLEKNRNLTVLTYREAITRLETVALLATWASKASEAGVPITVANTSAAFEEGCVAYLMQDRSFREEADARHAAKLVNGYTDRVGSSPAIFLRPGAQGTGTAADPREPLLRRRLARL